MKNVIYFNDNFYLVNLMSNVRYLMISIRDILTLKLRFLNEKARKIKLYMIT